jgi:hypothetical protein
VRQIALGWIGVRGFVQVARGCAGGCRRTRASCRPRRLVSKVLLHFEGPFSSVNVYHTSFSLRAFGLSKLDLGGLGTAYVVDRMGWYGGACGLAWVLLHGDIEG